MMKKIYSFMLAALAVCAVSCQDGPLDTTEPDTPEAGETMTFTASLPDTKVSLGEPNEKGEIPTYWDEDDVIYVYETGDGAKPIKSSQAVISDNGSKATFVVQNSSDQLSYAIYAQNGAETNHYRGTIYDIKIPNEQKASFNRSSLAASTMIADASNGKTNLEFKNVVALLKVNIAVDGVKSIELTSDKNISGKGQCSIDKSGLVNFKLYDNSNDVVNAYPTVKLVDKEGKDLHGIYYIAIAPTKLNRLILSVNGKQCNAISKEIDFTSSSIFNLGTINELPKEDVEITVYLEQPQYEWDNGTYIGRDIHYLYAWGLFLNWDNYPGFYSDSKNSNYMVWKIKRPASEIGKPVQFIFSNNGDNNGGVYNSKYKSLDSFQCIVSKEMYITWANQDETLSLTANKPIQKKQK